MQWVETTGKTVDEAKDRALDQLGVDETDAEFEILEEPRPGLFGRMRGEARVRARVRPTRPRPKTERRDRRRRTSPPGNGAPNKEESVEATEDPTESDGAVDDEGEPPVPATTGGLDADAIAAGATTFLGSLLSAFGIEAKIDTEVVDGDVEARVTGDDLGLLIGPRGQTLAAVQDLARMAVQRGDRSAARLRIDIGGYRERRRDALERFTRDVADQVLESGDARVLEPMSSADRKIVHDTVHEIGGLVSVSEGEEPFRRVVIRTAEPQPD
jgi:spoIIIJ-associated protein